MKQGKRSNQARISFSEETLVNDLEGHVDLGMRAEACRVARQILSQQRISPQAFDGVIIAIGALSEPRKWLTALEAA